MSAAEGKAHADQAMALLRKAVDMGYRDVRRFPDRVGPSTRSASGRTSRSCSQKLEKKSAAKPEK